MYVFSYACILCIFVLVTVRAGRADRRMESLTWLLSPDGNPTVFFFSRMIEEPYVKVANAYAQQYNYLDENPVVFLRTDIASAS